MKKVQLEEDISIVMSIVFSYPDWLHTLYHTLNIGLGSWVNMGPPVVNCCMFSMWTPLSVNTWCVYASETGLAARGSVSTLAVLVVPGMHVLPVFASLFVYCSRIIPVPNHIVPDWGFGWVRGWVKSLIYDFFKDRSLGLGPLRSASIGTQNPIGHWNCFSYSIQ